MEIYNSSVVNADGGKLEKLLEEFAFGGPPRISLVSTKFHLLFTALWTGIVISTNWLASHIETQEVSYHGKNILTPRPDRFGGHGQQWYTLFHLGHES